MLQRGHSGDRYDLASTLCKYDLRKGDLFVRSWASVQRVRRGSSCITCLCVVFCYCLLWLDAWRQYIYVYIVHGTCLLGYVGKFVVYLPLLNNIQYIILFLAC